MTSPDEYASGLIFQNKTRICERGTEETAQPISWMRLWVWIHN